MSRRHEPHTLLLCYGCSVDLLLAEASSSQPKRVQMHFAAAGSFCSECSVGEFKRTLWTLCHARQHNRRLCIQGRHGVVM